MCNHCSGLSLSSLVGRQETEVRICPRSYPPPFASFQRPSGAQKAAQLVYSPVLHTPARLNIAAWLVEPCQVRPLRRVI